MYVTRSARRNSVRILDTIRGQLSIDFVHIFSKWLILPAIARLIKFNNINLYMRNDLSLSIPKCKRRWKIYFHEIKVKFWEICVQFHKTVVLLWHHRLWQSTTWEGGIQEINQNSWLDYKNLPKLLLLGFYIIFQTFTQCESCFV